MAKTSKKDDKKKSKLIRDSFTIPRDEHAQLEQLKITARTLGLDAKKSELLRAGIASLASMSPAGLKAALANVVNLKTGRPAKAAAPNTAAKPPTSTVSPTNAKATTKTTAKKAMPATKKPVTAAAKSPVTKPVSKSVARPAAKPATKATRKATATPRKAPVKPPAVAAGQAAKPPVSTASAKTA